MDILQTLIASWQVRHTRRQKDEFLQFAKEYCEGQGYACRIEENKGWLNCRNFVVGDPETARIVLTAHYDTCSRMPTPNMVFPERRYLSILASLPWILCIALVGIGAGLLARHLTGIAMLYPPVFLIVYFGLFALLFFGPANPHTANDNTSGVAAALALLTQLPEDRRADVACILFDNEEYGLVGSKAYNKAHKAAMEKKLVLNLDCIGDGDQMYLILPKDADEALENLFRAAFPAENGFTPIVRRADKIRYNSDQRSFPRGTALAAFRKGRLGNMLGRIHTPRDIVCDEANIQYAVSGMLRLIGQLSE